MTFSFKKKEGSDPLIAIKTIDFKGSEPSFKKKL